MAILSPDGLGLLAMPQVVTLEGEEGPGIRLSGGEPQLHRPSKRGSRKRARKTVTPREA